MARGVTAAERQRAYRKRHPERTRAAVRRYRKKNPERVAAINRKSRWLHPETRLLQLARSRARRLGLAYDLTPGCITVPSYCPVLNIPLFVTARGFSDNAPTLDRVDNSKGYVVGNVLVVSWRANRIKADATPAELRRIAEFYGAY